MILLDFLYNVNKHTALGSSIWDKLQIKRAAGLVVKILTNYVLPLPLRYSNACLNQGVQVPIIVSLTSFPARIANVWMTIESLLCQSHKPKSIILWLSRDQFPNELSDLPVRLVKQQERGLVIRFVDGDIRSFKKFYYAFQEFKNSLVMTLDDDLLLPSYFMKSIYDCKLRQPESTIASFGFRFSWSNQTDYIAAETTTICPGDTGRNLFFGSGGGTLFDTKIAAKMDAIEKTRELCPTADDIYLNALVRICGYSVTFHLNNPLLSVVTKNDVKLVNHNGDIGDPTSINAKQLKQLVAHLKEKGYVNPFEV